MRTYLARHGTLETHTVDLLHMDWTMYPPCLLGLLPAVDVQQSFIQSMKGIIRGVRRTLDLTASKDYDIVIDDTLSMGMHHTAVTTPPSTGCCESL